MAGSKRYISTVNPETGTTNPACGEQEQTFCEPECLVHPNFFCGQLLTDADLNALISWSKEKFRLDRYKNGWGVVHGLSVSCANDQACGLRVSVSSVRRRSRLRTICPLRPPFFSSSRIESIVMPRSADLHMS